MKNILLPIDFSEASLNALEYTEAFFKNTPATIYLLAVYTNTPSKLIAGEYNEEWEFEMVGNVSKDIQLLAEKYNDTTDIKHNYKGIVMTDSLINSIKRVVEEFSIDLVITGTKGAKGLKEVFIGTNTLKMIRHLDRCPILVIPNSYEFDGIHQIVFSTNYKRQFKKQELKDLIKIAILHDANIEVAQLMYEEYLNEVQKKNKLDLQSYLEDFEFTFKKLDWEDSEAETIQDYLFNSKSELLALINHKYNFFNKLTEEDVIKKVSFHSKVPILILPEK